MPDTDLKLHQLSLEIEKLRLQLQTLVQGNRLRLQCKEVYQLSVELDGLIDQFNREVEARKTGAPQ